MRSFLHSSLLGVAYLFLLAGSFYFGMKQLPVEMGTTILAASIALAFLNIDRIRKFKGAGFEAEMHEKVEALVAKETEPPEAPEIEKPTPPKLSSASIQESDVVSIVVQALGNSKYTWRSIAGLATEIQLHKRTVHNVLHTLHKLGQVVSATTSGKTTWALTEAGRELLNSLR